MSTSSAVMAPATLVIINAMNGRTIFHAQRQVALDQQKQELSTPLQGIIQPQSQFQANMLVDRLGDCYAGEPEQRRCGKRGSEFCAS